jgi:hypothetical protein
MVGKANGSRERAPDDRLRVPTLTSGMLKVGTAQVRLCPSYKAVRSPIPPFQGMKNNRLNSVPSLRRR